MRKIAIEAMSTGSKRRTRGGLLEVFPGALFDFLILALFKGEVVIAEI